MWKSALKIPSSKIKQSLNVNYNAMNFVLDTGSIANMVVCLSDQSTDRKLE